MDLRIIGDKPRKGSTDGINVQLYKLDEVYSFETKQELALAKVFLDEDWAEEVSEKVAAPKTKQMPAAKRGK